MTTLLDPPVTDVDAPSAPEVLPIDEPVHEVEVDPTIVSPVALALAVVSGALSSGGAAWMVGGIFRGPGARLVGFLGVIIGAGLVYAATRFRATFLTYLVPPVSLVVGAVLIGSASGAGTSSLGALVKDAATSSQVLQPPIDFAPGWRLIVVVILALLSGAACALALTLRRPRLAVALPAPLTLVAALAQPSGTAITTSAVSVGFVLMALATSYAADGVGDTFDRGFELRRLARSLLAGLVLVAALIAASRISFLFPDQDSHRVVPPRRPPVTPPPPDVPLYTVKGALDGPLRIGVIDVYDVKERAWLLPPVDNARLQRIELPADAPGAPEPSGEARHLTVTVEQATGHLMPLPAGARRIGGRGAVDWDPRTQTMSLGTRPVYTGLRYDVDANPAPNGEQLSAVDLKVPDALRESLTAPPVPPSVQALLDKAPQAPFARLQTLRAELYKQFIASGQGKPTDVSADRVVELLNGATGNPYELTASEALLTRWAGIPARMGFGYYNGTAKPDGSVEFRPASAATYLEAWFGPYGWIPIVGTPPKAQQSLSNNQRNNDSSIQSSPELGINVFLPVRDPNRLPLYAYVRYYLYRVAPIAAVLGLLVLVYPIGLKRLRDRRRAEWAAENGAAGRVAIAYCGLRDRMIDLALPGRGTTPLELVELIADDEEHTELAWLVTRGLWGDLRASLGDDDADNAVRLAGSVADRLAKAQPETARLLAAVSRASLRRPHSIEIPNVWFELGLRGRLRRPTMREIRRRLRRSPRRTVTSTAGVWLVVALLVLSLAGCGGGGGGKEKAEPVVPFPTRLAPEAVAGLQVHEEPKATEVYAEGTKDRDVIVAEGKVLSFNRNGLVQAALQVAQLKPGYRSDDAEVSRAISKSVGNVRKLAPQHGHDLVTVIDGTQRIYSWFPTVKSMALLVVRTQVSEGAAEALARGLIDYGDGGEMNETALAAAFAGVGDPEPAATTETLPPTAPAPAQETP
jgi:hypothetical protein